MVLYAVEPGLATTGGPLNLASSPHARRGARCAPEKDRARATADRTDVEGFVALEIVEGCTGRLSRDAAGRKQLLPSFH